MLPFLKNCYCFCHLQLIGLVALIVSFIFEGNKVKIASKEMVMEHDVLLDEVTLLPFVRSILKQAGFVEQKPMVQIENNAVANDQETNSARLDLMLREDSFTAVYKAIEDCRKLRHSIKEIKPVLSFLIHGGQEQAKLLAKKFSTKLPIKRCRAILTIYCLPSTYLNGRAPRGRKLRRISHRTVI